ncbi:MAG: protein kinase [Gemmatimonadetes bacterium]|nr:protein kinase [Gemmatimonadota bacterium]
MPQDIRAQVQASLGDAYGIERELGGGGMSRTFVALERALERRVVVKVLSPELAAGVSVERFKREILLAAQLQHPHVVPVLASGDADGLPWFTMPYVEGESLRARLGHGALGTGEAVNILKDVARALAFAHSHGVVHRDIKPDNVLLSQGSATVTDFGIAKAISAARHESHATLTMAGTSLGSPAYMAPEQAAGDPDVDHRADIYAFGCMAYELLAGRPPFQAASPSKLLGAHLGESPKDVRDLNVGVPSMLGTLVMQCLAKDPAERPQQATDLVRVLDSVTSSGTTPSAPAILAGKVHIGRALALWSGGTAIVALTAWAATVVIGLPDWVLPGSIGVMLAGLPIIGFTAWVQRVTQQAYTATPTYTPGGGTTAAQMGTLHTIAIAASPHVSWKRTWTGGAVAVGSFVVLVGGFMVLRAFGIGPAGSLIGAGKLSANDQIIIADFRAPADDPSLGLTTTEALRADLSQSSVLQVLPRLATIEVLRLMQRPVDTPVDFELARAIASREGLKAVLDGDIVSIGGRYVLSTRLISAQDGTQLATFKEEAESQNDIIPAIGRLGKQVRSKVGESLRSVRAATALDRVTTSSMDALRKYTAANLAFDQTGDYSKAIPLMREAVDADSTFAMAARRLAQYYNNTGQFVLAQQMAVQAHKYADRLSEVERQLTIASYYQLGPTPDDEKTLAAYNAVLGRDPNNFIALNNASLILAQRREWEKASEYRVRAAGQPGTSSITFGNAVNGAIALGDWALADSLQQAFVKRFPTNPTALTAPAFVAAARGEFDRAEQLEREALPRISGSRTAMINHLGFTSNLARLRGKVRESLQISAEQRAMQLHANPSANVRLGAGLDSVVVTAVVLEDPVRARALLDRALRRAPIDSIPRIERNYGAFLSVAALLGDSARAREWHAAARKSWSEAGNAVARPGWEAFDDAMLAFSRGRYEESLASLQRADQANLARTDILESVRFLVLDRLQNADSAIVAGEAYLRVTLGSRLGQDASFRAGIHQRLGEMYEAKGDFPKALEHYTAFVDLWKDADPELQPRVRDVRARVERLRKQVEPRD